MNLSFTLSVSLLTLATVMCAQQQPPKPATKFDSPRIAHVNERITTPVYLCKFQGTEVTLPQGELLRMSTVGDSSNWQILAAQEDRRDLAIRALDPLAPETIANITSDHDNRYVLLLVLDAGHCDSHVTLEADSDLKNRIETVQPWVSPEKYQEALRAAEDAKKQAAEAQKRAQASVQTAEESKDKFRASYPEHLVFDYTYNRKKAEPFGLESIFHDDRFTYVKAQSEEPPVLFEIKDGKPSLIEFDYSDGLYRTARVIDQGYLVRGGNGNGKRQEKLEFKREPKSAQLASNQAGAHQ